MKPTLWESFLRGCASVLDLGGTLFHIRLASLAQRRRHGCARTDAEALTRDAEQIAEDWRRVGEGFRRP